MSSREPDVRTIGSLFSGVGGLDLGVEAVTGARVLWQVERDAWCRSVLARHWPEAARFADVNDDNDLEPVDLVCGGPPCPPVSLAGKRKGMRDDRWLWPAFERVLRRVRPRFAFLENVAGLLTADEGDAFGAILGDLAALGFDAEWTCLRAADAGAPHLRERVFILAHADRGEERVEPEREPERGRASVARREGAMADAGRKQRPAVGSVHEGQPDPARRGEALADGDLRRRGVERLAEHGHEQRSPGRESDGRGTRERRTGSGVEDAAGQGPRIREGQRGDGQAQQPRTERDGRVARALRPRDGRPPRGPQPGVGGDADGLPGGMGVALRGGARPGLDELLAHRWPAPFGAPQFAYEPPRTVPRGTVLDRTPKLQALGNAVVAQQAALAFLTLWQRLFGWPT